MSTAAPALTLAAAVGSATSGGVLFGFSTFVMRALDSVPPSQAITAMQAINRAAPNPWFMGVMFGSAVAGAAAAVGALGQLHEPWARWTVAATVASVIGLGITVAYHVPRNDALALVDATAGTPAHVWASYAGGWVRWNHVRAAAAIAAATGYALALRGA